MRNTVAILIVFLFVAVSVADARGATITLKGETDVASEDVRLGDVADITGTESSEQLEALRSVAICSAPPPAEAEFLGLNTIALALRAHGVDLYKLEFTGSRQVLIRRAFALVPVEELRQGFLQHVSRQTGWPEDTFFVSAPKNLDPIPVPMGERTIAFETDPGEDFCGSVFARFVISVDGKPYRAFANRFTIERYVEALVAVHKIPRGQPVEESDVEITKVERSRIERESLAKKEQAVGLLAVRTIYPGVILRADFLTSPPVVQRGQDAAVVWDGNGFDILTKGRVLEDGCQDELVRVRLSSRKIVKARVLDSKTLRITKQGDMGETFQ